MSELEQEVVKWIVIAGKSDLPHEFHAKKIINLCMDYGCDKIDAVEGSSGRGKILAKHALRTLKEEEDNEGR